MELLRPEDRDRLLNLRTSSNAPSTQSTPLISHDAQQLAGPSPSSLGFQQQQEALAVWRGQTSTQTFKPFDKNPSKQARYELYLNHLKQGDRGGGSVLHIPSCTAGSRTYPGLCLSDALEQSLDPGMTEWERSREREEFVRASILYRPTSSFLSSRFTSAKQEKDDDTVQVVCDQEVRRTTCRQSDI